MEQGETVPFDGDLLSPALSLKIGAKAERCDAVREIELRAAGHVCEIRIRGAAAVRGLVIDAHQKESAKLEEALRELSLIEAAVRAERDEAIADRWNAAQLAGGVGVLVGIVATVALGVASVWVASNLADVVVARSP